MRLVAAMRPTCAVALLGAALWAGCGSSAESGSEARPQLVLRLEGGRDVAAQAGVWLRAALSVQLRSRGQTLGAQDAPWTRALRLETPGAAADAPRWSWVVLGEPVALHTGRGAPAGAAGVKALRGPVARFAPGVGPWRVELAVMPVRDPAPEPGVHALAATLPWRGKRLVSNAVPIRIVAGAAGSGAFESRLRRARLLLRAGDPAAARTRVEALLAEDPARAGVHVLHGDVLAAQGRPEQALDAFRRALLSSPPARGAEEPRRYLMARMERLRDEMGEVQAERLAHRGGSPPGGVPEVVGLRHLRAFDTDATPALPAAETTVHIYEDEEGNRVLRFVTAGVLWAQAWIPAEGGASAGYALRDTGCIGRYDERLAGDADLEVPACVVEIAGGGGP